MPGWVRRLTFLFPLCAALLTAGAGSSEEPSFSRSRWKEEMSRITMMEAEVGPERPLPPGALTVPSVVPRTEPAKAKWVRVSRDILAPDSSSQGQPETQTEVFLALNPQNEANLLAAYQEGRFADGGARSLAWAYSKNSGKGWTEGLLPELTPVTGGRFQRASDPWVAFGPGNRAYYASLLFNETDPDNGVFLSASANGGKTWGPPVAVHLGGSTEFDDKEAVVVDTRADSPFRGRVYVGWDSVLNNGNEILRVSWSDDGGQSFSPPAALASQGANLGIIPLVGPGGVVHAVWFHADRNTCPCSILAAHSEDGGATWSAPVQVAAVRGADVNGLRTGGLPTAAVDPRNGRLYAAWQDDLGGGVDGILLARSDDGGSNWSAPELASGSDPASSFTPALAVGPTGRVALSFYSLRNDPERRFLVDHYLALSGDGASFGAARRTTKSSFDVRFAAVTDRGFFLGDYQGLVVGKKLVYALWVGTLEASRVDPPARQPDAFVSSTR
ncbi:MAG: sialidase family protein [Acidobacteriota bacterium]